MSKREAIARYNLIIKKLRKSPSSFEEIAKILALESEIQQYDFNISKRTFQRDLEEIRSIYNIDIQYDNSRKVYCIKYDDQSAFSQRIFEAFDVFNALNISDRLSDYIHFENRHPQGTENLYGLLHAVKNRLQIKFSYQKFWEVDITNRLTDPYALKEFKNRWYLLAKDSKDNRIKTFALDRLSELEITRVQFQVPSDYDVNKHFEFCFGIISPNDLPLEEVILSFDPVQGKYIKSLPLHHTQQVIVDNENELRVSLKLYITFDFTMELLSFGYRVKVIKPVSLIKDIESVFRKTLKLYEFD